MGSLSDVPRLHGPGVALSACSRSVSPCEDVRDLATSLGIEVSS